MATDTPTLQQFVDRTPDLVDYFYNEVQSSPHTFVGERRSPGRSSPLPPAWSNWQEEQRAWREAAVLFDQSHHMPQLYIRGPGAFEMLKRLGVNSFANFVPGKAKQFVGCNPRGQMVGECVLYCHGGNDFELVSGMHFQNWVRFHAETGGYDVQWEQDLPTAENSGSRTRFRFGMDGPNAEAIFQEASEGGAPNIPFFNFARVRIAGCEVTALRHGMAGHKGVELSGRFEDGDKVRARVLDIGRKHGLKPGGAVAYFSACAEGGWMPYPTPAVYTGEDMRAYREWLPANSWEMRTQIGGSFRSRDIEDYYVTPWDMGYDRIIKFDHDFIGAEALQAMEKGPRRTAMSLVWNHEDVVRITQSLYGSELPYKHIAYPQASYCFQQNDAVRTGDGRLVGLSCFAGYSINEREMISLALIDRDHAEVGTELTLTWGEPDGGSRKLHVERHRQAPVRVKVGPRPYARAVQEMRAADLVRKA